jgi:hypothetical protein
VQPWSGVLRWKDTKWSKKAEGEKGKGETKEKMQKKQKQIG